MGLALHYCNSPANELSCKKENQYMMATAAKGWSLQLPEGKSIELNFSEPLSEEEFDALCRDNPDLKTEREPDGKIVIMAPVYLDSGYFEGIVFTYLSNYSLQNGKGRAYSPSTGFKLPDGSTRSADASWVSNEKLNRLTPEQRRSFAPVVPDFVVEVRSDSDSLLRLQHKMTSVWIAGGTSLAWLIDPLDQKAYIYRKNGSIEGVAHFEAELSGEDVLPGFVFPLRLLKL